MRKSLRADGGISGASLPRFEICQLQPRESRMIRLLIKRRKEKGMKDREPERKSELQE